MTDEHNDHDHEEGTFGEWLQENLRIIISIIIVALLAMGIYSYSKRTNTPEVALDDTIAEDVIVADVDGDTLGQELEADIEELTEATGEVMDEAATDVADATAEVVEDATDVAQDTKEAGSSMLDKVRGGAAKIAERLKSDDADNAEHTDDAAMDEKDGVVSMDVSSKETAGSYVETAAAGEGVTHLARKAAANYLTKNPHTNITGSHKVYIEDYLRKNVSTGRIDPGTTVEFSKDLIGQAIAQSQNLSDADLQNLQKYALAAGL